METSLSSTSQPFRHAYRGGSMRGTFRDGDCLWILAASFNSLQVGDVVAFDSCGKAISHRIVGREAKGWVTRGDACFVRDVELLFPELLIGRVMERERAGARDAVTGGTCGLRRARWLHATARLQRMLFHILAPPYRLLRASHLVAALWRPQIVKARFVGPEGDLIKRIHRGRTVACWSLRNQRWDCRKPYDLVLERGAS